MRLRGRGELREVKGGTGEERREDERENVQSKDVYHCVRKSSRSTEEK